MFGCKNAKFESVEHLSTQQYVHGVRTLVQRVWGRAPPHSRGQPAVRGEPDREADVLVERVRGGDPRERLPCLRWRSARLTADAAGFDFWVLLLGPCILKRTRHPAAAAAAAAAAADGSRPWRRSWQTAKASCAGGREGEREGGNERAGSGERGGPGAQGDGAGRGGA